MRSIPDTFSVTQSPSRRDMYAPSPSQRAPMSHIRHAVIAVLLLTVMALGLAPASSLAPAALAQPAHTVAAISHSVTAHVKPFGGCGGIPAPC